MTTNFDVFYFINKFKNIPEDQWTTGVFSLPRGKNRCHCALGHCGMNSFNMPTAEANSLALVLYGNNNYVNLHNITNINDLMDQRYPQSSPKGRILAALRDRAALLSREESP